MRKGPVWSLKRSVNDDDPAAKAPSSDNPAFDSLEGVAPIDNAPKPARQQPKKPSAPVAVDDFFQEQPQDGLMGLQLELWEGVVPSPNPGPAGQPLAFPKVRYIPTTQIDRNREPYSPLASAILSSLVLFGPLAFQPDRRAIPISDPRPQLGRASS